MFAPYNHFSNPRLIHLVNANGLLRVFVTIIIVVCRMRAVMLI